MTTGSTNDPHHWTPDVLMNVTRAVTVLCRSQENVIDFLLGAGVDRALLVPWRKRLAADRRAVRKRDIAQEILLLLNDAGDRTLAQRREIVRRIVQFENFDQCWPDDVVEAKALVGELKKLVDLKDSVTVLRQQARADAAKKAAESDAAATARAKRRSQIAAVRAELFGLFGEPNVWTRGHELERVLNSLFKTYDIHVRDPFTVRTENGVPLEQIDGVISLDGHFYLVEMKWEKEPIGAPAVGYRISRLLARPDVRGIFISASGFSEPAVASCRDALGHRMLFLCHLREITTLLEHEHDLAALLRRKIVAASVDRDPFLEIISTASAGP